MTEKAVFASTELNPAKRLPPIWLEEWLRHLHDWSLYHGFYQDQQLANFVHTFRFVAHVRYLGTLRPT